MSEHVHKWEDASNFNDCKLIACTICGMTAHVHSDLDTPEKAGA